MTPTAETLIDIGRRAGLAAVGVCRAEPFTEMAETLRERKEDGLHGGMQFTYRNPERSTDPSRILPRGRLPGGGSPRLLARRTAPSR